MKQILGFLLPLVILSGCTKDIINDGEGSFIDDRNIELQMFYSWNGWAFHKDSLYQVGPTYLYIDELKMVFSGFKMSTQDDTLYNESSYDVSVSSLDQRNVPLGRLKPGGYYGKVHFLMGLDMQTNLVPPSSQPEYSPLKNVPYRQNPPLGYNFLTLKGRAFDPSKPDETSPSLSFEYVVATNPLVTSFMIDKSFSMGSGNKVLLNVQLDIRELFNDGLDPATIQFIKSDPSDNVDFDRAQILRDNLEFSAFKVMP